MSRNRFSAPPYLDWRLDRWKLALLLGLFLLLLLLALFWPDDGLTAQAWVNFM